jgi:hypothetical protein
MDWRAESEHVDRARRVSASPTARPAMGGRSVPTRSAAASAARTHPLPGRPGEIKDHDRDAERDPSAQEHWMPGRARHAQELDQAGQEDRAQEALEKPTAGPRGQDRDRAQERARGQAGRQGLSPKRGPALRSSGHGQSGGLSVGSRAQRDRRARG